MNITEPSAESDRQPVLRFDQFMHQCLYGENGFYTNVGRAGGHRGDFITSPEVGPLFGEVVANAIDHWWEELGSPSDFVIYDVGCGPGALLRSIGRSRPDRPWTLVGVDIGAADTATTPRHSGLTVEDVVSELPSDIEGAVVLGNELLDNMPFRIIEKGVNGLNEVFVEVVGSGRQRTVTEMLEPYAPGSDGLSSKVGFELESAMETFPVGARAPLLTAASAWVAGTLQQKPARICLFDYGAATTAELVRRGGWLRTYYQHQRGSDPYGRAGYRDITTDVPLDQLPPPASVQIQAEFLARWGIANMAKQGRDYWQANAHAPDLAAMKMRSRVSESEALLDPAGLGSWRVAEWTGTSPD